MDAEHEAVLVAARPILARMELLSYGTVTRFGGRRGADAPGPPAGDAHPLHEAWARRLREAADAAEARALLEAATDALEAIVRRRFVVEATETLEELCARIVADGRGFSAEDCAIAMRCTPTLVRRARLEAGRHPDTGGGLPQKVADAMAWARELSDAGLSLRQIEAIAGVPKSSLHRALA